MASKILELVVSLLVEGGKEVATNTKLVEELKKAVKELGDQKINKLLDFDTKNLEIDLDAVEAGLKDVTTAAFRTRQELEKTMATLRERAAGEAQARIAALRAEMDRLKESAAAAKAELQKEMEVLREAALGAKAAETAKLTAEMEKLSEAAIRSGRSIKQIRELFNIGKLKFDLDVSGIDAKLAGVRSQVKQTIDLVVEVGRTPVHLNTAELQKSAEQARAAANRLGNEIMKLNQAAGGARSNVVGLGGGLKTFGQEAGGVGQQLGGLNEQIHSTGREFLFFRRLLFGLGFGFVAQEILNTVKAFDSLRQTVTTVFGEANVGEEMAFIRENAERLGIRIQDLGKEYAKLAVATRAAGFTQQETRDVFLSVAEAGAKLALSQEEIQGALTAVQQIASKGRLSLEELRQQLGDRLPGAIQIAAKALGITERKLFAMVEQGQIASDVFLKVFPAAIRASFGTDATTRIETTAASIQRFKNAVTEFTDVIARSGALDGFVRLLEHLTALTKDPAVVDFFKTVSRVIGTAFTVIKDHTEAIADLLKIYVGFKAAGLAVGVLQSLTTAHRAVALAATGAAAANTAANASMLAGAGAAGGYAAALNALNKAFVVTAVGAVAIDAIFSALNKAQDAAFSFAEAQRQIASSARLGEIIRGQREALEQWGTTVVLSTKELRSLEEGNLRYYKTAAEGARDLAKLQVQGFSEQIKGLQAQLKLLELSGDRTEAAKKKAAEYRAQIAALGKAQTEANAQLTIFNNVLADVILIGKQRDISFDSGIVKLRELSDTFVAAGNNAKILNTITYDNLDKETRALIDGFKNAVAEGKNTAEALKKAFPHDLADGSADSVRQVINAMTVLQTEAKVSGEAISTHLAKALDSLTANQLLTFELNAKEAFRQGTVSAEGMAIVVDTIVKAAVKNLGVDLLATGDKVTKTFREMVDNLVLLGVNAKQTSGVLKAALEKAISTAKTRDELTLLRDKLVEIGLDGSSSVEAVRDAFQRLDDKLLGTKGVLDTAVGDSFKFFGIQTAERIAALAELSARHFNRIRDSGLATARELREAWIKLFDTSTLGKAFSDLGIQSSIALRSIADQARESFKDVADSGQATAADLIKAYENLRAKAIAAGEGTKNLQADTIALGEAMAASFARGTTSAEDYQKALIEASEKTRLAAVAPVGAVQAAFATFGAKTRGELIELYNQAVRSFNIMAGSGQATSEVLQNAAQEVEKRWLAAFGAIEEAAKTAFDNVSSFAGFRRDFPAFDVKALRGLKTEDLKDRLRELQDQLAFQTRPGVNADPEFLRTLLAALNQLIAELNRRGENTGLPSRQVPVTNNGTFNFNFSGVTPDEKWIRNFFLPMLERYWARKA